MSTKRKRAEPAIDIHEAMPVDCMPVHYSLCIRLIEGRRGAVEDLKALYRERMSMLESAYAAERATRAQTKRGGR